MLFIEQTEGNTQPEQFGSVFVTLLLPSMKLSKG